MSNTSNIVRVNHRMTRSLNPVESNQLKVLTHRSLMRFVLQLQARLRGGGGEGGRGGAVW